MKKKSFTQKAMFVLVPLAGVFLALSIASAVYSVNFTVEAIEAIGTVEYTPESKSLIDTAQEAYDRLDPNLDLPGNVSNRDILSQAKAEYVRLAIKEMYLALQEEADAETVGLITDAREAFDAYFTEEDSGLISNYADLVAAEAVYGTDADDAENTTGENTQEELELC